MFASPDTSRAWPTLQKAQPSLHTILNSCNSPQIDTLVVPILAAAHIAMVPDDFADVFRRHVFLLSIYKPKLPLLREPL